MNNVEQPARSTSWRWWVCGILLLATLLNYSNRFTLTQNAVKVQKAFRTDSAGYGVVSGYFSLGFALGGLAFGVLADLISVRWLYPFVVVAWSLAGISSALVDTVPELSACQFMLGFFEAGHWPCALRTTQRILKPDQRTLGNSILQSGASLGAVITPLLVLSIHYIDPEAWRLSFYIVGLFGMPWVLFWVLSVRGDDLRVTVIQTDETAKGAGRDQELQEIPFWRIFITRRWWILFTVTICINLLWHYARVWLPETLEKDYGYGHDDVQYFIAGYYLTTFFGSIAAGWLTAHLVSRGVNVFRSRLVTFLGCALLSTCTIPAAFLPAGPLKLAMLLVVAFGSLGLFPIYYSMNQELSARNQGKVSGALGFSSWGVLYFVHPLVGSLVKADPTVRPYILASVGLAPLVAFAAMAFFWGRRPV